MKTNRIPESYRPLIVLGNAADRGASAIGSLVGLVHNPASAIIADRDHLETTQAAYLEARGAHAAARLALRLPATAAREFCMSAVDVLKNHLGRRWNARWQAVGFLEGSIALPADPHLLLISLAAYLRQHPEHENAPLQITAAKADTVRESLAAAGNAAAGARAVEVNAKRVRDAAFKALRQRLCGLRAELALLLAPDDARWHRFGFRRPAEVRMPEPVTEVEAHPCPSEAVVISWTPSRRAKNYRVTWRLADGSAEPVIVDLFTDPGAVVTGLPPGKEIIIEISARNRSGETAPSAIHVQAGVAPVA